MRLKNFFHIPKATIFLTCFSLRTHCAQSTFSLPDYQFEKTKIINGKTLELFTVKAHSLIYSIDDESLQRPYTIEDAKHFYGVIDSNTQPEWVWLYKVQKTQEPTFKPVYKTKISNLTDTQPIYSIYPKIDSLKMYPEQEKEREHDRHLQKYFGVSYGIEQLDISAIQPIYNLEEKSTVVNRIDGQFFLATNFDLDLGMKLSLSSTQFESLETKYYFEEVSLGPILQYPIFSSTFEGLFIDVNFLFSFYSQISSGQNTDKIKSSSYRLGIVKKFQTDLGRVSVDFGVRRQNSLLTTLDANNPNLNNENKEFATTSLGLLFTWEKDLAF